MDIDTAYAMYRFERWLAGDGTYNEIDKQTESDPSKFKQWIEDKTSSIKPQKSER